MSDDNEVLSWVSHPARARRKTAIFVLLFMHACFIVVYSVSQSIYMVSLAGLVFMVSLSTFFFATRYEISKEKVKVKYLFKSVEKEMKQFRSFYPDRHGLLLSPFPRPSRLENFRGLFIRYHLNKPEVDAFVKKLFEDRQSDG